MNIPKAGEIMKKGIYSIEASATLLEAAQMMLKTGTSLLVVTDNSKPIGVLSSGELFNSFCLHVAGHFPDKLTKEHLMAEKVEAVNRRSKEFNGLKVRDIMTPKIKTIKASQGIDEAISVMKANDIRRLMVEDEKGNLVGILTRNDTLCRLMESLSNE